MKREAPYEVEIRGVTVRCYTLEDAAKIIREFSAQGEFPQYQKWQPHEFLDFVNRIQVLQRQLLATLLKTRYGVATDEELRKVLGIASNQALAGVLSGITKVAQLMEIDRSKIYSQRTEYKQGSPVRWYRLSEGFKSAAVDNDWPTDKDLEEPDDDEHP
ncbi:MAG: hypothetical protein WBQ76_02925 [Candidatus Korobacteraceae bacterium]